MKFKRLFAVFAALFAFASSLYAFDGKTFWREYGGGLKSGDFLVNIGVGARIVPGDGAKETYAIPPITLDFERMVHINDMLPFSFGVTTAFQGYGIEYDTYDSSSGVPPQVKSNSSFSRIDIGGTAKYHFNFGVEKLDVYAGLVAGVSVNFAKIGNAEVEVRPALLLGGNAGASWFFTDKIALSLDAGYPHIVNIKFTLKI